MKHEEFVKSLLNMFDIQKIDSIQELCIFKRYKWFIADSDQIMSFD